MEQTARSVSQALSTGIQVLLETGVEQTSRNGPVLVLPYPYTTIYTNPVRRVLFCPIRNANPFFHFMEAMWMLAGRGDVAWPSYYAKRIATYSDNGASLHGAYGHRWRKLFGFDQLDEIVKELKTNPDSRRAVLTMWSPELDIPALAAGGKDVPCNTHAYFGMLYGAVNMTVCCRSNDIIWGAYGANMVHFSYLHEYIATRLGADLGVYRQMSNNFHAYLETFDREKLAAMALSARTTDLYEKYGKPRNLRFWFGALEEQDWHDDLATLFSAGPEERRNVRGFRTHYFREMVWPIHTAYWEWKHNDPENALETTYLIEQDDWAMACRQWLERRITKENK